MTGVDSKRSQKLGGNGIHNKKSGTETTMEDGITGDHPRVASPMMDGHGIMATGIMKDTSTGIIMEHGKDSKVNNGSLTVKQFQ